MANPQVITLQLGPAQIPSWSGGSLVGGTGACTDGSDSTYFAPGSSGTVYFDILNGDEAGLDRWVSAFEVELRLTGSADGYVDAYLVDDTEGAFNNWTDIFESNPAIVGGGPTTLTIDNNPVDPYDVPLEWLRGTTPETSSTPPPQLAVEFGGGAGDKHLLNVVARVTVENNSVPPPADHPEGGGWRLASLTPGDPQPGVYREYSNPSVMVDGIIWCFPPRTPNNVGDETQFAGLKTNIDTYWPFAVRYDTAAGQWSRFAQPPAANQVPGWSGGIVWVHAMLRPTGTVLLLARDNGGSQVAVYEFDPADESYTARDVNLSFPGGGLQGVALIGDYVIVEDASNNYFHRFDLTTDSWTTFWQVPPWGNSGFASGATDEVAGKSYWCKGGTGFPSVDTTGLWVYDLATDTWSQTSDWDWAHTGREVSFQGLVAVGTEVWVVGGYDESATTQPDYYPPEVDVYDTLTDTWRSEPDFPTPMMYGPSLLSDGTYVWLLGGMYWELETEPEETFPGGAGNWSYNALYTNAPAAGVLKSKLADGSVFPWTGGPSEGTYVGDPTRGRHKFLGNDGSLWTQVFTEAEAAARGSARGTMKAKLDDGSVVAVGVFVKAVDPAPIWWFVGDDAVTANWPAHDGRGNTLSKVGSPSLVPNALDGHQGVRMNNFFSDRYQSSQPSHAFPDGIHVIHVLLQGPNPSSHSNIFSFVSGSTQYQDEEHSTDISMIYSDPHNHVTNLHYSHVAPAAGTPVVVEDGVDADGVPFMRIDGVDLSPISGTVFTHPTTEAVDFLQVGQVSKATYLEVMVIDPGDAGQVGACRAYLAAKYGLSA